MINSNIKIESDYFETFLTPEKLKKTISRSSKCIKNLNYDTIAFRGMSGAILAPLIAVKQNKQMILVRHPTAPSHSVFVVEGNKSVQKYIIVDDFIEQGKTVCEIIKEIKIFAPKAKCLGILIACDGEHSEFLPLGKFKQLASKSWKKYFQKQQKS